MTVRELETPRGRVGLGARMARLPRFVPAVLLAYAACRLLTGVLMAIVARHQVPTGWNGPGTDPVTYLTFTAQWDGQWYQQIAEQGYPGALPVDGDGVTQQNAWAFYPSSRCSPAS